MEQIGHFIQRVTSEIPKFDDFGDARILARQFVEDVVDCQHFVFALERLEHAVVQLDALAIPAKFWPAIAPRPLDKNPPHGFSRGAEEMGATVPPRTAILAHKAEIGFVHQCGRLKRLPGLFLGNEGCGEATELVVHERQELLGRLVAALAYRFD